MTVHADLSEHALERLTSLHSLAVRIALALAEAVRQRADRRASDVRPAREAYAENDGEASQTPPKEARLGSVGASSESVTEDQGYGLPMS